MEPEPHYEDFRTLRRKIFEWDGEQLLHASSRLCWASMCRWLLSVTSMGCSCWGLQRACSTLAQGLLSLCSQHQLSGQPSQWEHQHTQMNAAVEHPASCQLAGDKP